MLAAPVVVGEPGLTTVVSVCTTTPPELKAIEVVISVVTETADVEGVGTACPEVVATLGSTVDGLESGRYQAPHISAQAKQKEQRGSDG